jgi:uncharacterized protein YcnI
VVVVGAGIPATLTAVFLSQLGDVIVRSSRPRTVRWWAAAAAGALGALALAGPAAAHVTVDPSSAPAGGYVEVSFRVPSESDTASTTKVQVFFPTDHPIASVALKPVPGWTGTAQTSKLAKPIKSDDGEVDAAVSTVTWQGGRLAPGQFEDFDVSLGPLPTDTKELTFKALQTYSDGSVVRWIDVAAPGAPEPDHPAPVLHLTSGSADTSGTSTTGGVTASATPAAAPAASGTDTTARVLGGVGIAVGAIGLLSAMVAFRRRPEPAAAGAAPTGAPAPTGPPEKSEED